MREPQARYWLMKSEPEEYSIEDLRREGTGVWSGVRNYQARNHMRSMRVRDRVLFYHSNARPPGVVGVAEVAREAYPDPTQFDPKSDYYDPRSLPEAPRWSAVDVRFVEQLPRMVSLDELKQDPALATMLVVRRAMRLSVQPVEAAHFRHIVSLAAKSAR